MQKTTIITLVVAVFFMCGTGVIMYYGRPVMRIDESEKNTQPLIVSENTTTPPSDEVTPKAQPESKPEQKPTQTPGTYTSAQVTTHATKSDCWSIVGGNVYDLTSWASRHPGGSSSIVGMCGIDATARFEGKHGGSSSAKAALALLKIGTLAK